MKVIRQKNSIKFLIINIQNMQINNATIKLISKAVKPTENEILNNPRARSSILRIAEKL